jgi:hypothetical protein
MVFKSVNKYKNLILFLLQDQDEITHCIYQTNPCKICKCPSTATTTAATTNVTATGGGDGIPNQIEDACVSQIMLLVAYKFEVDKK